MRFGYARVSTEEQGSDRQVDALESAGCERIYLEKASGANHLGDHGGDRYQQEHAVPKPCARSRHAAVCRDGGRTMCRYGQEGK